MCLIERASIREHPSRYCLCLWMMDTALTGLPVCPSGEWSHTHIYTHIHTQARSVAASVWMELISQRRSPTVCLSQPIVQLAAQPPGRDDIIAGQWYHGCRACSFLTVCMIGGDEEGCVCTCNDNREINLIDMRMRDLPVGSNCSSFPSHQKWSHILFFLSFLPFFFFHPVYLYNFFSLPPSSFCLLLTSLFSSLFSFIFYCIIINIISCWARGVFVSKFQGQSIGHCLYCD